MNHIHYLNSFKNAANRPDKKLLSKKQVEVETGIWLECIVLRLQKKHWANSPYDKPHSGSSIFFSVWLNDKTIKKNKILYNIHALKLRQLKGYAITSKAFASGVRKKFKNFEHQWPNVSVDFGPQTLMQGWEKMETAHLEKTILELADKFLEIDFLIDDLLGDYKLKNIYF